MKGAKKAGLDVNKPYRNLGPEARKLIREGNGSFFGLNAFLKRWRRSGTSPCTGVSEPLPLTDHLSGLPWQTPLRYGARL
jgi:hypothetical protein